MVWVERYVLFNFHFVHSLEKGKPVSDTGHAHVFQILMLH